MGEMVRNPMATWNTCTKGNKCNGCDRILQTDKAAKMSCNVTNDCCQDSDPCNGYNEGKPTIHSIYSLQTLPQKIERVGPEQG